jgi:hypothetical protein
VSPEHEQAAEEDTPENPLAEPAAQGAARPSQFLAGKQKRR